MGRLGSCLVLVPPGHWSIALCSLRFILSFSLGLLLELVLGLITLVVSLSSFLVELGVFLVLGEEILFNTGQVIQEHVHVCVVQLTTALGEVASHARQQVLVDEDKGVECALSDAQTGQMGQEIVSNEETQEHEVVDNSFEIKLEWQFDVLELQVQGVNGVVVP